MPHLDAHRAWTFAIAFLLPFLAEPAGKFPPFVDNLTGNTGWTNGTHNSVLERKNKR